MEPKDGAYSETEEEREQRHKEAQELRHLRNLMDAVNVVLASPTQKIPAEEIKKQCTTKEVGERSTKKRLMEPDHEDDSINKSINPPWMEKRPVDLDGEADSSKSINPTWMEKRPVDLDGEADSSKSINPTWMEKNRLETSGESENRQVTSEPSVCFPPKGKKKLEYEGDDEKEDSGGGGGWISSKKIKEDDQRLEKGKKEESDQVPSPLPSGRDSNSEPETDDQGTSAEHDDAV